MGMVVCFVLGLVSGTLYLLVLQYLLDQFN
jgi:uncharacterized membrane protein